MDMVEQPDRLEAEALRFQRDLRRPLPRVEWLPAVVFAHPALGHDRTDLHSFPPRHLERYDVREVDGAHSSCRWTITRTTRRIRDPNPRAASSNASGPG